MKMMMTILDQEIDKVKVLDQETKKVEVLDQETRKVEVLDQETRKVDLIAKMNSRSKRKGKEKGWAFNYPKVQWHRLGKGS